MNPRTLALCSSTFGAVVGIWAGMILWRGSHKVLGGILVVGGVVNAIGAASVLTESARAAEPPSG